MAVIGNDNVKASLPASMSSTTNSTGFLDAPRSTRKQVMLSSSFRRRCQRRLAARFNACGQAFQSIDGAGLARVDFFLKRETKELLINELEHDAGAN